MTGLAEYVAMLPFLLTAAVTDVRRQKIYNWTTYPGILAGIAVNAAVGWIGPGPGTAGGWAGLGEGALEGLMGFLACGFVMLFCFVLFPIGGGDVKLVAMIGAFLGVDHGIEVLLWTFVLGAVIAIATLIWQVGVVELVRRTIGRAWFHLRTGGQARVSGQRSASGGRKPPVGLTADSGQQSAVGDPTVDGVTTESAARTDENNPLQQELFLGVAALLGAAAVMVRRSVW